MARKVAGALACFVGASLLAPAIPALADPPLRPNGYKVYLSPALHSGGHTGCDNFGENANARAVANAAALELEARGYTVRVGTGDFTANTSDSNAWGPHVHLPIHSNAKGNDPSEWACAPPYDYSDGGTWTMYANSQQQELAASMLAALDDKSPGTNDRTCTDLACFGGTLHELRGTNAPMAAYLEVGFHTFRPDVDWMRHQDKVARAIARGLDRHLGYPRANCNQGLCAESLAAQLIDVSTEIIDENSNVPGVPGLPGDLSGLVEAILDLVGQVDPGPVVQLINQLLDTLIGSVDPAELIELVTNIVNTLLDLVDPAALVQLVNQLVDTVIGIVDPEALIDLVDRLLEAVIGLVDIEQLIDLVSALLDTLIGLVDIEQLIDLVSALLDTLIGLVDIEQLIDLVSALLDTLIGIVDLNQLIDTVCRVLQTVIQCGGLPPVAVSLALPGASGPASPV